MKKNWDRADIPSQQGKLAVVTGANRGLGFEIADALAAAGATVVMACRDAAKARAAAEAIRKRTPNADLEIMAFDAADLASVRRFAQEYAKRHAQLDILCHNAAAILAPPGKTRDGFETHLGVNHFAPFGLTGLLLDRLAAAPAARVVSLSSMAHKLTPGLDFDDLDFERKPYRPMDAYGKSKLATLLFMFELDRRAQKAGLKLISTAAHPGWSNTNPDQGGFFMRRLNGVFAQPPARGALPALYAATAPDVAGGDYFGPGGFQQLGGHPARVDCRPEARDPALAARLWQISEAAAGVEYL